MAAQVWDVSQVYFMADATKPVPQLNQYKQFLADHLESGIRAGSILGKPKSKQH